MSRRTLSNLGIHLDAVGRREGAFAPTEQAVEHYRRLAQTNPAAYGLGRPLEEQPGR